MVGSALGGLLLFFGTHAIIYLLTGQPAGKGSIMSGVIWVATMYFSLLLPARWFNEYRRQQADSVRKAESDTGAGQP